MIIRDLGISVVEATERRILDAFSRNKYVSLSFSGGKDSICLSEMVIRTMQKYGVSFSRLMVTFYDEEAIYPDVEKLVMQWRSRFMSLGARFYWFCLPIRHYNCCNQLANDESFICWEPGKESVWIRQMPKFAIRSHKDFKMGMSYQEFSKSLLRNIPQMVGLRANESLQRCITIGKKAADPGSLFQYPIYDWTDNDVWLFIKLNNIEIPVTYLYLYKAGVALNKLRISQFFSVDTIKTLPKVLEFYPDLYEKVLRREPNADLVMLYWDTDMFRSSKQDNKFDTDKDYKTLLREEIRKASLHPDTYPGYRLAKQLLSMLDDTNSNKTFQKVYQILIAGDPKKRSYRVVIGDIRSEKK